MERLAAREYLNSTRPFVEGPEARIDTMADDQEKAEQDVAELAIKAWNTRAEEER